jgi:hypothetical protein
MRACKFAKPAGGACEDGTSKRVTCEKDGEVKCLKECMVDCVIGYEPKAEVVFDPSVAHKSHRPSYNPAYDVRHNSSAVAMRSTSTGGCGAPCGGTPGR